MSSSLYWPVPLPSLLHPHIEGVERGSLAFLKAFGLGPEADALAGQGIALGMGLAHPDVSVEWLGLLSDWTHLYTLWDDAQAGIDEEEAAIELGRLFVLCVAGSHSPGPTEDPVLRAAADLGGRLRPRLEPGGQIRFLESLRKAAAGFAWEARVRARRLPLTASSLRGVALHTVGAEAWWELGIAAEQVRLPDLIHMAPPVVRLRGIATQLICLQHHLLSYARHRDTGDRFNLLSCWREGPVAGHIALCEETNTLAALLVEEHLAVPMPVTHQRGLRRLGELLVRGVGAHLAWAGSSTRAAAWEEQAA